MGRHLKPIGGEFWYDKKILSITKDNFEGSDFVYLDGGQSAIEYIIEKLNPKDGDVVLMPSYLCPEILNKFKSKKIQIEFYSINFDLSIDLDVLKAKIQKYNVKAVLFIDYFGFFHSTETIEFLTELKNKNIVLIEDAVQVLWFKKHEKFIGNYIFNSFRKFFPVDGSLVIDYQNKATTVFAEKDSKYNEVIYKARMSKTDYIEGNFSITEESFLKKFELAEKLYYEKKYAGAMLLESKKYLSKIDFELIKEKRLSNYKYLNKYFEKHNTVKRVFEIDDLNGIIPLCFPVIVNNRDRVRRELRNKNIYCPVHWDITNETELKQFEASQNLSKNILSLPIDWRYEENDMDALIENFEEARCLCDV